jgi:hypothetical protein
VKTAHVWPPVFLQDGAVPHSQDVHHRSDHSPLRCLPARALLGGRLLFQRPFDVPVPISSHHSSMAYSTLPHDSVLSVGSLCNRVADGGCCAYTRPRLHGHSSLFRAERLLDRLLLLLLLLLLSPPYERLDLKSR